MDILIVFYQMRILGNICPPTFSPINEKELFYFGIHPSENQTRYQDEGNIFSSLLLRWSSSLWH